jgi:hypothetical protein
MHTRLRRTSSSRFLEPVQKLIVMKYTAPPTYGRTDCVAFLAARHIYLGYRRKSMAEQLVIGCSGGNYGDPVEKGGWVGSFYPDSQTKRLRYYSEYFLLLQSSTPHFMTSFILR